MPVKQVYKRIKIGIKPLRVDVSTNVEISEDIASKKKNRNKNNKENEENMTTEQFDNIEGLVQDINVPKQVKVVKKDRGLIERTESSKIVLTEDNRQVLSD